MRRGKGCLSLHVEELTRKGPSFRDEQRSRLWDLLFAVCFVARLERAPRVVRKTKKEKPQKKNWPKFLISEAESCMNFAFKKGKQK
jgi:hypothetical protein